MLSTRCKSGVAATQKDKSNEHQRANQTQEDYTRQHPRRSLCNFRRNIKFVLKMETIDDDTLRKSIADAKAILFSRRLARESGNIVENDDYEKFSPDDLIRKILATESDGDVCARDVRSLVRFYLLSTSEVRFGPTSPDYDQFQRLTQKYRVEKKVRGNNVTLHRIAAAFPFVCINLLRCFKIERKFSTAMLTTKNAGQFPWCMRTQMCLSLAPIDADYTRSPDSQNVIFAVVVFMYYENKTANEKKKYSSIEIFERVSNIAHAIYNDSIIDEEKRKYAWNRIMFDYAINRGSVDGLLNSFKSEIPEAEAAFKNRFNFVDRDARGVYTWTNNVLSTKQRKESSPCPRNNLPNSRHRYNSSSNNNNNNNDREK